MSQTGGTCIFCGQRGGLTKQHILPDRIKRLVPRITPYHSVRSQRFYYNSDGSVSRIEPSQKIREGHLGNRRFRVVCQTCNNGWMNAAETNAFQYAEPLIVGRPIVLGRAAQDALETLAALILTMVDLTDLSTSTVTEQDRRHIKDTRRIPPGWFLFLGRVSSPEWQTRYLHDAAIILPQGTVPTDQQSNAQITTVAIGKMLLHLAASQSAPILANADRYARLCGFVRLPSSSDINVAELPVHDTASMIVITDSFRRWMQTGLGPTSKPPTPPPSAQTPA